jgi:hypothetical protein
VRTQKANTATTIENVLTALTARKNPRIADILFPGCLSEVVMAGTAVSAKIRFRCFSATIKIRILRINIKVSGK